MGIREILRGAMGRGYCTNENSGEEIDATLIEAMLTEIISVIKDEVMKCLPEKFNSSETCGSIVFFSHNDCIRVMENNLTKLFEEKVIK